MNRLSGVLKKQLGSVRLDLSFLFGQDTTVLTGRSGAGKTTFLNMLSGIDTPDEGVFRLGERVLFDSEKGINIPASERNIGHVFQQPYLFPHMTVRANISFAKKGVLEEEWMKELLQATGVDRILSVYPAKLSGGEKQRVNLLRTLAAGPEAIVFDEPFSSLDRSTRRVCQDIVLSSGRGIPYLFVTHDEEEAIKMGTERIYLEDGRLQPTLKKIGGFPQGYQGDA